MAGAVFGDLFADRQIGRQTNEKLAAPPNLALHVSLAAVYSRQMFDDCESEPSPPRIAAPALLAARGTPAADASCASIPSCGSITAVCFLVAIT